MRGFFTSAPAISHYLQRSLGLFRIHRSYPPLLFVQTSKISSTDHISPKHTIVSNFLEVPTRGTARDVTFSGDVRYDKLGRASKEAHLMAAPPNDAADTKKLISRWVNLIYAGEINRKIKTSPPRSGMIFGNNPIKNLPSKIKRSRKFISSSKYFSSDDNGASTDV